MTESQLRYQALVKAAAAASGNQQQSSSILNAAVTNGAIRTGAGGAPQYSSPHLEEDAQRMQQYALRRKLYFSPGTDRYIKLYII